MELVVGGDDLGPVGVGVDGSDRSLDLYVGHVERGEVNVALRNTVRIADALGVDPGELVSGCGANQVPRLADRGWETLGVAGGEDVDRKFRAAWEVFGLTCGDVVANEATFQAWFAHYVISQFGIDRVAREPDIGLRHLTVDRSWFPGNQVRVDLVVTRQPGVEMPHRASLDDRSGIERLGGLAATTELKVANTQKEGVDHTEICKDFWKLSMVLAELDERGIQAPHAYVGVLDNHPTRRFSFEHLLERRLAAEPADPRVQLLRWSQGE